MQKLVFKRGIGKLIFPFMLHNMSPWQTQIKAELWSVKKSFYPRKNVEWGYRIENGMAEIYVTKTY